MRMQAVTVTATDAPSSPAIFIVLQELVYNKILRSFIWMSVFFTLFSAYLWITILRQDLQHRRFSALNVSYKHQFTPHHQRLRISPFLHDVSEGPVCSFFLS